jgi:hypothetical protein
MDFHHHSLPDLFEQLGLMAEVPALEHFIERHGPMPAAMLLADAPFWSATQACFLREELLVDADWAEVVDDLNSRLHS